VKNLCLIFIFSVLVIFIIILIIIITSRKGSRYVDNASLVIAILLPQPPECWDYSHFLLHVDE
jgi:hypothetical protein